MGKILLFEDAGFANLLPLVYWRSVFELRCGRMTLAERAVTTLGAPAAGLWTRAWMADVAAERFGMPVNESVAGGDVVVNGRWLPEGPVAFKPGPYVATCEDAIAYVSCDESVAERLGPQDFLDGTRWLDLVDSAPHGPVAGGMIRYPWDLVSRSPSFLCADWRSEQAGIEGNVHSAAVLIIPEAIRVAPGAQVMPLAVLDATDGPIVVEEGVVIRPHAYVAGPAHLGAGTIIHPHAFIHGGCSIGPHCKIGGELDACVFQGYSNKAHEGFLGHSYVGSWVNLGAGTVNSDLKNTYGTIRVPLNGRDVQTELMFFGAAIADHVKTGIRQAITTGSVIGFAVNVACGGIVPRFVRSFTWLTDGGVQEGDAERLATTAAKVMARRDVVLTDAERALFEKLPQIVAYFEHVARDRKSAPHDRNNQDQDWVPQPQLEDPAFR